MIGQTISHYRIAEKLGEGGMGVVYRAEDTKLRRPVALKFLRGGLLGNEQHRRFVREAQAAAALNHPNICTVYEIEESADHVFIAMEFVEGESIKEKFWDGPFPLKQALDIAAQAALGLHAAHEKGIIHRDIKSANLMVTPDGQAKLMDFGLAKVADRSHITKAGAPIGTIAYMSPEQAMARPVDRRTDIWSLGVVLYEMLTDRLPFPEESEHAVIRAIIHNEPQPPSACRAGLPAEVDRIVGRALSKNLGERYQNAEELRLDLRALVHSLPDEKTARISGRPHRSPAGSVPEGPDERPRTPGSPDSSANPDTTRDLGWIARRALPAVAALALLAALLFYLLRG